MMTQMVHIAWRAAAFASKDTVDGMSDLVSETKWQHLTHTPLFLSVCECLCQQANMSRVPIRIEKNSLGICWLLI